jgi:hypothetical protein
MIRWRNAVVAHVRREWPGAVEVEVTTGDGPLRALAYPALTGRPRPGDRVLLNATAVELGLGTGGYALVIAVPDRLPDGPPGPGHLVKARYTPMQACVAGADEQGSPHHEVLRDADDLGGMPVVVADLHSALPAILAGLREAGPRVAAYVMLDGGALPAWFSRSAAGLREAGWLAGTVSTGQSFGGDLETVTVHTGLLAARHVLGAEVAVVTQGPGNLGTGTRWGFSGVACGEAVNAAAVLGGRPVASLRVSEADARAPSRRVAPQPHRLQAGWPWPAPTWWCRCSTASSARWWPGRRGPWPSGTAWSAWKPVASRKPWRRARSRCPRWAAAWTRTAPISSPRPRRDGTPQRCCADRPGLARAPLVSPASCRRRPGCPPRRPGCRSP